MSNFSLRDYQVDHCERIYTALRKYQCALDASDTGTGKTYVALECCRRLDLVPLVVSSRASRGGWEEASEVVGVPIEFVNYERARSSTKASLGRANTEWLEEVPWGKGSFIKLKQAPAMAIFDEVHRCGGATSLNSKILIAAKRQARYVMGLSATAADSPLQMKALGFALGLHNLSKGKKNWMSWILSHGCTPGTFGGYDFNPKSERGMLGICKTHDEIFVAGKGSRMRKAEIPSFPKTSIETKMFTWDGPKINTLPEGLEEAISIRQKLELAKVPFLIDLALEHISQGKVVIFVNFTATRKMLFDSLLEPTRFGVAEVHGDQNEIERRKAIQYFCDGPAEIMICNSDAGGESLNLQVADLSLISPCESGKKYKQILGRINRDGGKFSRQLICFLKGTYEEKIAHRMEQKGMNIDLLNDAELAA